MALYKYVYDMIWYDIYNGWQIGTFMQSVECAHFQLPSVTPNLDFTVMVFLMSNNSKMVQDRAIVTMADQYKVLYDLSIGDIFTDLNDP